MTGRRSERASADEGKAGAGRMGGDVAQGEDGEGEGQDEGEGEGGVVHVPRPTSHVPRPTDLEDKPNSSLFRSGVALAV